ncbi:MAG: TlpA disulfide reductase family protein [Alphaproteobacteria bacterium]|nr:TlpA disulfide reductase family protein [Alphaproteobacteria bacterium]
MTSSWRVVVIVLTGAIVAAAGFAVYTMLTGEDQSTRPKLAGMENFIPAREFKPVPPVHFLDEQGNQVSLERFRGSIVVLNLWATWCTPCLAEMPMLDRLQQQLKGVGVVVIALSIDRDGTTAVREFFNRNGIRHLAVYVDPTMRAQSTLATFGLPTTILIDKQGRERGRLVGPAEWDDASAADLVLSANAPVP